MFSSIAAFAMRLGMTSPQGNARGLKRRRRLISVLLLHGPSTSFRLRGYRAGGLQRLADAVPTQQALRHGFQVPFVGAVVDARRALVCPPKGDGRLVGHAEPAERLERPIEHTLHRAGDGELDEGDLGARREG